MNGDATDAGRSHDGNIIADVVCLNFFHTTHMHTILNILFNVRTCFFRLRSKFKFKCSISN